MRISIRPVTVDDAAACGRICYEAFGGIASAHRFPMDWGSVDMATQVIAARVSHRFTCGIVAEAGGAVVGSAFLKEYHPVGAIGPVTVSPRMQGGDVGRMMMEHLIGHAKRIGLQGARLVQAAYNPHSLALYLKLGFEVREFLVCLHGKPIAQKLRGYAVRPAVEADLDDCSRLGLRLHGYPRTEDLVEALALNTLSVAEHGGRITGYTTGVHFRGHTIAETNEDAMALIAAAQVFPEPGLLMPARNAALLRWALEHGLRITQPLSLMTLGLYHEPGGAFLPSIHA